MPEEVTEVSVVVQEVKEEPRYRTIQAIITAYNEGDDFTPGTTMANGDEVHEGAVANDVLPLGTVVIIDGEEYTVKDRFGAGHPVERFDMYLSSRGDCERWGVQRKTVKVKEE